MRTYRYILTLVLLFGTLITNAQDSFALLEKAFKKRSDQLLEDFLIEWQSTYAPLKSKDSLSCIEKDIYTIFEDFYNPFNLARIGSGEFGEDLYSEIEFAIVQNSIHTYTYDKSELDISIWIQENDTLILAKDSIMNFRPDIYYPDAAKLYLSPAYDTIINQFLGNKHYSMGTGNIMNPAMAKGNSSERVNFLNRKLKIIHGHWGGYWHIETHPEVFFIVFNRDRSLAEVHYRLAYQGGKAKYSKENGKWVFMSAGLTWIE